MYKNHKIHCHVYNSLPPHSCPKLVKSHALFLKHPININTPIYTQSMKSYAQNMIEAKWDTNSSSQAKERNATNGGNNNAKGCHFSAY
jgi:hypothetical protein